MRSIVVVEAALFTDKLMHSHRQMYGALLTFADAKGACWPTIKGLAAHLGVDRRHVSIVLAQMASLGLVARERMKNRRWRYQLLKYFVERESDSPKGEGKKEPISTTETPAARASEAENKGEGSLSLVARRKRACWLRRLEALIRERIPQELERFLEEAARPAKDARPYLNRIDAMCRALGNPQPRPVLTMRPAPPRLPPTLTPKNSALGRIRGVLAACAGRPRIPLPGEA